MTPTQEPAPDNTSVTTDSALKIYSVVLAVGVACSVAIVATYETTRPIIQTNRLEQRRRAILNVVSDAETTVALIYAPELDRFNARAADSDEEPTVFAGYTHEGQLTGFAIAASGMGYQDTIRLLYGYDPERQIVTGIRVLESRETPGLGDRIETDEAFLANFERLDVRVENQNRDLEHEIEFVKAGQKTKPWQIDGITGATVSSEAVVNILADSTRNWIPLLRRSAADLTTVPRRSVGR